MQLDQPVLSKTAAGWFRQWNPTRSAGSNSQTPIYNFNRIPAADRCGSALSNNIPLPEPISAKKKQPEFQAACYQPKLTG